MAEPTIEEASFKAHLEALGRICISWAVLDRKLTDLVSVLIGCGPYVTACIFTGTESLKPRCEAIKKLAVYHKPSPEWRDKIIEIINRIQNDIGKERNRYIHDEWFDHPDGPVRLSHVSKTEKVQPPGGVTGEQVFISGSWTHHKPSDLANLIERIEAATQLVTLAVYSARAWQQGQRPPTSFWL